MATMRRGQVSTEVTIILGVVIVLMLPVLLNVYLQMNDANEKLYLTQANTAATRLAYAIDSVGNLGPNASMIIELKLPAYVTSVSATGSAAGGKNQELVFSCVRGGPSGFTANEIVKNTRFDIQRDGSLDRMNKPGTYNVEVRAQDSGRVLIRLYPYA